MNVLLEKYFTIRFQIIFLVILSIGLNFNTLFNSYALDDGVVMTENSVVEKGFKGIPEIFTKDLFYGFDQTSGDLSEARYRPISLLTFAIEHQFFGENPMVSHLINVVLFALLIFLLYKLLGDYVYNKQNPYLSFFTCLLFVVHPIHTEVIANVKSRDEIIAFILLISMLLLFFRHLKTRKTIFLLLGSFFYFLALLTRESAITFVALVPLFLFFFSEKKLKEVCYYTIPLVVATGFYLFIRYLIIFQAQKTAIILSTDVMNAPFLWASPSEAFATKVFILLKYMGLLIIPHPLSFDYGFNQIPYIQLLSVRSILSFIAVVSLLTYSFIYFRKKSIYSFSILYFFITISIVSNFIVDTGTPLSERFLFQPSFAFCLMLASLYVHYSPKLKYIFNVIFILILVLFSVKTIARNAVWKDNETLALTDVNTATNSVRTNKAAMELFLLKGNGASDLKTRNYFFEKAIYHGERTLSIYPNSPVVIMELGTAYYALGDYFKTAELWIKNKKMIPPDPNAKTWFVFIANMMYKQANGLMEQGNFDLAIKYYSYSAELDDSNVETFYNLGGCYLLKNDSLNAESNWDIVRKMTPNHVLKRNDFMNEK